MRHSKTIPQERAATIVPGPGTTALTPAAALTFATAPIQINAGDTVVVVAQVNTTASALTISSPSNPGSNWQHWFFSFTPFFMSVWVLQNPVPANEPISFTRATSGFGMAAVQIYSGVAPITNVVGMSALAATDPVLPSLSPVVTTTVPNSMAVGGFYFNRGTSQSLVVVGQRVVVLGASYSAALIDQLVATPASAQVPLLSSSNTPAGSQYFGVSIVLVPSGSAPPPLTGIPAIVQAIIQWRLAAQRDKIHVMRGAQRATRLAEHAALAKQLKQAQIAQRQ